MNVATKSALMSIVLLATSASAVNAVAAGSGTITFSGDILEAACSFKPESTDQAVALGQVAKSQLATGGITNTQRFQIELTGCSTTGLTDKTVTAVFTGAESTDVPGALGVVGTAQGAGIMMVNGSGDPIVLGTTTSARIITAGDNTLVFGAYLKGKATGDITPGDFTAVTNFSLAYQ